MWKFVTKISQLQKQTNLKHLQFKQQSKLTTKSIQSFQLRSFSGENKDESTIKPKSNVVDENQQGKRKNWFGFLRKSKDNSSKTSINDPNSKYKDPPPDPVKMRQLFSLVRPELKWLALSSVFVLSSSAMNLAFPAFLGQVLDIITNPQNAQWSLETVMITLGSITCINALSSFARNAILGISSERIVYRLRQKLYNSILGQDVAFFDSNKTGELVNRLSTDTSLVGRTLTSNVTSVISSVLEGVGAITVLFWMAPQLTLVSLAVMPPVAVLSVVFGRYFRNYSVKVQDALASSTDVAEERFSAVRTIRTFNQKPNEEKRYEDVNGKVFSLSRSLAIVQASFFGTMQFFGQVSMLSIIGFGGYQVMSGAITVGTLTSFIFYSVRVFLSVSNLTSFYGDLMKALGASARIFQLLNRKPKEKEDGSVVLENTKGEVTFRNVSFAYPTRPEAKVLENMNFTIPSSKVIAFVGASGSGKSTIGSLLVRLYEPSQGEILLDGSDISQINRHSYHSVVGIISQDVVLFDGTVSENIAYGIPHATLDQIQDAAQQANAHNFIAAFPDGYNTRVGERGVALSGGQAQRIAIARTILTNPKILILDEASSSLDAMSEYQIQQAIEKLVAQGGRTVIVIAHRLNTIRRSDAIMVLMNGKIVENGTYDELMNSKQTSFFRDLVELQNVKPTEKVVDAPQSQLDD